ncbi:KGGVGR-motif variant AAA ATPase, partial [Candidatus Magnetaquicoccus inordinatus]|uniref:KGGVGR-motif variant AAA ATPase n=1 Tax=Candidatus Magnetaquicoccus inordinatus TaxID=2496818 RepID=UPI00102BC04D
MRIFTFYSFKGGVGRSSLMFHLGDYWASKGYVVALLDMDLHAPGISLHPWLEKPRKNNEYHKLGISDLLTTFYMTQNLEESTFQFFPPSLMLRQLKPPKGSNRWGSKGRMMVLPSGSVALPQVDPVKESQKVPIPSAEASESEEPEQKALRYFARLIREDLESFRLEDHPSQSGIDFLLIDCRTGYLAMEELAMGYLAERVVLVSGLNHQNLEGLDLTLQKLRPQRVPPLYYSSELLVAFGPVPAHYMDDPQARQSLEKAMGILEKNRLAVKTGERAELLPPYFLLPYTPHLATSDEPVPQGYFLGRHHPYWEVVEQIADTLVPQKSVEDSKREILRQMLSITGTVLPPAIKTVTKESALPTAKEKKGEELEEESAISQNLRHPTRQNLAMMFQLPKWYWPVADDPKQQRAWLKRYGFPAQLSDTQDKLLDGLCA